MPGPWNSPAEEFGIHGPSRRVIVGNYPIGIGGDFIVAIDGKAVEEGPNPLAAAMSGKRSGEMMDLTIYRNGKKENLKVKLGAAPQQF